jgi:GTP-binding protein
MVGSMAKADTLPSVVIVGRPNVGKSTLFNALTGQRRSIVGDEPGITRDRIHGEGEHRGRRFELIDTGGIVPHDAELIPSEIFKQARVALENAAHIIFLIDGRSEITGPDRDLARILRRLGRPVAIAVNKIDAPSRENLAHEFYTLGFPDLFPVSAEHRHGLHELLDHVTATFPIEEAEDEEAVRPAKASIRVSIIGRPNVGKSTLLNALVGSERAIVSPVAGTTRDAVDEALELDGIEYVFVDTAGIRRKGKTRMMAEKLSVVMARRHIRMAHVVVMVIDAVEGPTGTDATVAGYAHEEGRGLILCVNKWDAAPDRNQSKFEQQIRDQFKFLEYAPIVFVSAKSGRGVERLFPLIREVYESASRRVTTGELNRFVEQLRLEPDVRVKYITQASVRPPTFVLFTDKKQPLHFSAERHLINQLRKRFGFRGTPIVVKSKAASRRPRS